MSGQGAGAWAPLRCPQGACTAVLPVPLHFPLCVPVSGSFPSGGLGPPKDSLWSPL